MASKHQSRRGILQAGAVLLGGTGLMGVAAPALAQDAQKLAHDAVQYQETPKDGQMCSICVNFVAPAACKIVQSPINPNGWCVAFGPKSG
jgi:hypothetical protein